MPDSWFVYLFLLHSWGWESMYSGTEPRLRAADQGRDRADTDELESDIVVLCRYYKTAHPMIRRHGSDGRLLIKAAAIVGPYAFEDGFAACLSTREIFHCR